MKVLLSGIYKANQCTDLNDTQYAIGEVNRLIKQAEDKSVKALYRRLISLEKRHQQLSK